MSDDGNRTERGVAPAPDSPGRQANIGTAETIAPTSASDNAALSPSASRSLPALDRQRYRVIGEVGRGGLGRILRAEDRYLDRPVAVKELLDPDDAAKARFVREALITARLQHPAIVPIYDAGDSEEKGPFYAMKLVAGHSLAEELRTKQTLEERLELLPSMITVVEAMAYAHHENIIHRDLKPQNVLVGEYGETVLIDWGLAKDLSSLDLSIPPGAKRASASSSEETMDGAVMGTPAFMPPEQAAGEEVGKRADVYALGAMLYYLICGAPPHGGKSMDEMLLKIVEGNVIPIQEREPRCPADLAAIVAKAMAKTPTDRYPTAKELAADLKKFQTGQLVGAHEYTLGERFRRWLKKHRGIVAVSTVALAILIGYGVWSILEMRERKVEAVAAAKLANANAEEANRQRTAVETQSMLIRARRYAATGHTAEEVAVLRALASTAPERAITDGGLIWKAHQRLAFALGHDVGLAARSADGGRFIATEPGALVTWDVHTGKVVARLPIAEDPIRPGSAARFGGILAISPGGKFAIVRECIAQATTCGVDIILDGSVFVPRKDTELVLRDTTTNAVIAKWTDRLDRRAIAFAADDSAIAIHRGGSVEIYDAKGNKARDVKVEPCAGQLAIASPTTFAIACRDHVLLDGKPILKGKPPTTLVFISADRLLAIGERVQLWDVTRGELRGEGALLVQDAQRREEEEIDEMAYAYFAPGAQKDRGTENATMEINVGHATSIVARTSVLSPPPRIGTHGAILSLEGHDWQSIVIHDDFIRYALVDQLVPSQPPDRCLARVGGERHAMTALDNGERLLVDQQELPLGLNLVPIEGYRHTTTQELPFRQLRPLVAAETDACLVWGSSVGATRVDGGAVPPLAGALADGRGGLVIAGANEAYRLDADGRRTSFDIVGTPLISPSGAYVASLDPHGRRFLLLDVATGKTIRTWTAPSGGTRFDWIAKGVVFAFGHVISIDPAIAPRPYSDDLVTDPRSPVGALIAGGEVVVQLVADGKQLARHAIAADSIVIVPDDTGRVIVKAGTTRTLVALDGKRLALADLRGEIVGYDLVAGLLVAHQKSRSDAWDLATGKLLDLPATSDLVAVIDDVLWMLEGPRKTKLVRVRRDGSQRSELVLQTPALPFDHVVDEVMISDDRKRLSARYAIHENLFAYAIWSLDSGALLWIGPPTASLVGDWIVSGGRAYVPSFELAAVLRDSGARTNLRVCEKDKRVVAVTPPPAPETVWAPPAACGENSR